MKIRFLKDFGIYRPGDITDQISPGVRDTLIQVGTAEIYVEERERMIPENYKKREKQNART